MRRTFSGAWVRGRGQLGERVADDQLPARRATEHAGAPRRGEVARPRPRLPPAGAARGRPGAGGGGGGPADRGPAERRAGVTERSESPPVVCVIPFDRITTAGSHRVGGGPRLG